MKKFFKLGLALLGGIAVLAASAFIMQKLPPKQNQEPAVSLENPPPAEGTIKSVIDGITFTLDSGHVIRYIGVRAPSVGAVVRCYGKETLEANQNMIGKKVRLEEDPLLLRSKDGAWTRYVYLLPDEPDGKEILINNSILEGGFALPLLSIDMKYGEMMMSSAKYASATGKGLWKECQLEKDESGNQITVPQTDCIIKGFEDSQGNKKYITPECKNYATIIPLQTIKGVWLCSEEEAQKQNYSKSCQN